MPVTLTPAQKEEMIAAARAAFKNAHAPYSNFPVGSAILTERGVLYLGCNVENASYGVSLCAECGLVSALHATGGGNLVAFACVDRRGDVLMPCGRCRQLLWENGGPGLELLTRSGVRRLEELLPDAFGPDDLGRRLRRDFDLGKNSRGRRRRRRASHHQDRDDHEHEGGHNSADH